MKPLRFEKGTDLQITYRQPREGPANFLVYRPHVSQIALTRKQVLKAARWPAKTPTGDALRQWLDEIEAIASLPSPSEQASDMDEPQSA
jgi:hypothetical protein